VTQDGEKNPLSRFAALRAITEQATFRIDDYRDWTIDWSQTPDGHYYSNKAPGSILLAVPVFWVLDQAAKPFEAKTEGPRGIPGYFQKTALSFLMQSLPFATLALLFSQQLFAAKVPPIAVHFFLVSLFFGQTAALFMNSWFGHGFAAMLLLWSLYAWWREKDFELGLALGALVLTEYQALILLPVFLLLRWNPKQAMLKPILKIILGALPMAILWVWYHTSAFGSPFALATQFYNPAFRDLEGSQGNFFGVIAATPNLNVILELLFGPSRGLLFTQPWVLLVLPLAIFCLWNKSGGREFRLSLFFLFSMAIGLIFNSMVGSWNGGYSAGPRYLSFILPAASLLAALLWTEKNGKILLIALSVSLVFRALVYATTILIPAEPLWPWMIEKILTSHSGTPWLRLGCFILVFALATWKAKETLKGPERG
jgi:hypothetical protein